MSEQSRFWAKHFESVVGHAPSLRDFREARLRGYPVDGEIEVVDKIDPNAPVVEGEIVR